MSTPKGERLPDISLEELIALCKEPLRRKALHIIDVSPAEQYHRGHIAYSFGVPLDEIEKKRESALPPDRTVVIYGASPEDAEKAAAIYVDAGFKVRVFKDGLAAWKRADQPVAA